ncbi:hypothetical protein Drose_00735 [Dactylosporangium roseum]|uniref:Uncharacterized protein n=1 Tax=Dactylosporangium roseum TaxID=47989 RepID=A0ABY5Z5P5_9ACTN|nr:SCO2522 family protein [Dactylosporangium roseum]UWZ36901.1 hypothetical protein Drose_00735 [Dactylosporangium roseum]
MHQAATFREAGAEPRSTSLPLSHLSIEAGHLYFEDFRDGPERLKAHFAQLAPWVAAAADIHRRSATGRSVRISTCFLIDDYFGPKQPPSEVLPMLLAAADANGVRIDYIARESACAEADGVELARLVEERIVADPPPGTNGSRPPVGESGWLSNGERSPSVTGGEAMGGLQPWRPPVQNAANRHSVFVDVQLWDEPDRHRRWSCAYLASVWELLRLGLLRYEGRAVAVPRAWEGAYPSEWGRLPAVMQVNPDAAPFSAYRSLSVLGSRFFATEQAVRTILSQVAIEAGLNEDVVRRAGDEGIVLPLAAVDRLQYVFTG